MPLDRKAIGLTGDSSRPAGNDGEAVAAMIAPGPLGGAARVVIASAGAGIHINGDPLLVGIRVLIDRDAIRIGNGEPIFFSAESLPQIVPFPERRAVPCARCKTDITAGMPAVKCPKCGAWHHQGGETLCWTYAEKCAACDQPTAMDGDYHWSPEGI